MRYMLSHTQQILPICRTECGCRNNTRQSIVIVLAKSHQNEMRAHTIIQMICIYTTPIHTGLQSAYVCRFFLSSFSCSCCSFRFHLEHILKFSMCKMRSIWELNYAVFPSEKSPSMLDWNKATAAAEAQQQQQKELNKNRRQRAC